MSEMAKEYAKALFELAKENSATEDYEKSLELLSEVFIENPQYLEFLSSPDIPLAERLDAFNKVFAEKLPAYVMSFVKLLCERKRMKYFNQCVTEYKNLINEVNRCSNAKVISVVELNEREKAELKDKLEKMSGHTILLECVVDKSILGGLIVELEGKTVDASIQGRLKNLKDVIGK